MDLSGNTERASAQDLPLWGHVNSKERDRRSCATDDPRLPWLVSSIKLILPIGGRRSSGCVG